MMRILRWILISLLALALAAAAFVYGYSEWKLRRAQTVPTLTAVLP